MTLIIPNSFADKTGQVKLEDLDENFTTVVTGVNQVQTTVDNIEDPVAMALIFGPDASGDSSSSGSGSAPAGTIIYTAASSAPDGYIKANGSSLSTSLYATLFSSIGYTYGGSGASFSVPDLRGEFLRAWDDGRGLDSGRSLGSVQAHDWKTLYLQDAGQNSASNYTHDQIGIKGLSKITVNDGTLNLFMGYWANNSAHLNGYWGSEEIRPRNLALLACIKY